VVDDIKEVLVSQEALAARIREMGEQISADYADESILMVGVLRGAVIFMADLARAISRPVTIDFIAVSSYGASTSSSGVVRIIKDLDEDIAGRHVLIVEDIIDSGLTLKYLYDNLLSRNPASVKICTLLSKPSRRKVDVPVAYNGFTIPDYFAVGYGLDYAEKYRNLPYVGVLKPEAYNS
jgi:hypoxanthine phosphoribosyltransferase